MQMLGKSDAVLDRLRRARRRRPGRPGPALDRLLADHRGPAAARQPGDPRRGRRDPAAATPRPTSRPTSGCATSSRACSTRCSCRDDVYENRQYVGGRLGIGGVAHQNGTIRFGTDPATSALDLDCKLHDVDNLYVADASFFVSSTAVNPTLTIIANALRVAETVAAAAGPLHARGPAAGRVAARAHQLGRAMTTTGPTRPKSEAFTGEDGIRRCGDVPRRTALGGPAGSVRSYRARRRPDHARGTRGLGGRPGW